MCSSGIGVDPGRPSVVFVGRITRQKGVAHLVRAAAQFAPEAQLVLCAGAPDTPEIGAEVAGADRASCKQQRDGVVWIDQMLPKRDVIQLLSHATVFACPSIYEPLGIVNLEAMACETAVVASATGGIVEVVVDGETGLLVPLEQAPGSIDPVDPAAFAAAFAAARQPPARPIPSWRADGTGRAPAGDRGTSAGRRSRSRHSRCTSTRPPTGAELRRPPSPAAPPRTRPRRRRPRP